MLFIKSRHNLINRPVLYNSQANIFVFYFGGFILNPLFLSPSPGTPAESSWNHFLNHWSWLFLEDDDVDKSRHIQLEAIHMNGHAGAHLSSHTTGVREGNVLVSNGCCSKMNITSNPLDPEESKVRTKPVFH